MSRKDIQKALAEHNPKRKGAVTQCPCGAPLPKGLASLPEHQTNALTGVLQEELASEIDKLALYVDEPQRVWWDSLNGATIRVSDHGSTRFEPIGEWLHNRASMIREIEKPQPKSQERH